MLRFLYMSESDLACRSATLSAGGTESDIYGSDPMYLLLVPLLKKTKIELILCTSSISYRGSVDYMKYQYL